MQAITDSFTQNCNCYPLLLQKCSTIKNSQLSSRSNLKDLSVALLFITFNTLFSFQGAIVVNTNSISLAATLALLLAHFVVSPLRFTNACAGLRIESESDDSDPFKTRCKRSIA